MSNYKTIIETGDSDSYWDHFISGLECCHHEQSTCWAEVKRHQGWKAIRIKVLKGSEWLAGAQILHKKLRIGGSVGYISSGPLYRLPNDEALDVLLRSINKLAKERSLQYVAITPYVENSYLDAILEKNGYLPTREVLPPTSTTRATPILDLSKKEEGLLRGMRQETRREIRLSQKSGISVREGNRADLATLFRLMAIVAERRGEPPVPDSVQFFHLIWDHFYPKGYVRLFVAELLGKPVSAGIMFTFGRTARFWKFGWSGEERRKYPNHLLYWELIRWSITNGFRYFDIVQVDPVVTDHLSLGLSITDELKSRRLYGPTLFKTGFGGRVAKFSGPWFRFKNPVVMRVYSRIGPRIISTPWMRRFISHIS